MRRAGCYSIRRNVISILLILILFTVFCLGAFLYMDNRDTYLQEEFVTRSGSIGEVFLNLDEMEQGLSDYMKTWDAEPLALFLQSGLALENRLEALRTICRGQQPSLNYIRRIDSFNAFQQALLRDDGNLDHYATLSYIKQGLSRQKNQALSLLRDDLEAARQLYTQAQSQLRLQKIALWLSIVLLFCLSAVIFVRLYQSIASAYRKIDENLRCLSQNEWDVRDLETGGYKELNALSETINQMKHEICNHLAQVEENAKLARQLDFEHLENEKRERLLVEAQMAALKSQVNPHFLFNTLNIIGKTALLGDPEAAMDLLESTAKILRYSLHAEKHATLRDELDIVETYLHLQKSRFQAALTFAIETDRAALELPIPAMIIQPIVENCFKHGFEHKKKLHICLLARFLPETVEITVRDNGDGFDPSILEIPAASGGIGLNNVRRRLELEFGSLNRMRITSSVGAFTEVVISLPHKKRSADEDINC